MSPDRLRPNLSEVRPGQSPTAWEQVNRRSVPRLYTVPTKNWTHREIAFTLANDAYLVSRRRVVFPLHPPIAPTSTDEDEESRFTPRWLAVVFPC